MQKSDNNVKLAIAVVESLRSGIPTRVSTRALPDFRDNLTQLIKQDLSQIAKDNIVPGRLIWGAYGQGKTHALTMAEHIALESGFAVSRVSFNREVSCNHLFNFYKQVASAIRTPNSQTFGIQQKLDKKNKAELHESRIQEQDRYIHPLPAIVLENYFDTTGEEQDQLYGDLMGTQLAMPEIRRIYRASQGKAMPKFPAFKVRKDASAYYGLMADTIVWCGYKGWVILIDEVELVGRLGKVARLETYQNLNWLLNWSTFPSMAMQYPIYTLGVVASSLRSDVWYNSSNPTKDAKSDHLAIPELAAIKNGEDAKLEMQHFFDRAIDNKLCPTTEPLSRDNLSNLLNNLAKYHSVAYNWNAELNIDNLIQNMGDRPVRTYIRAALETLDIQFLYQENIIPIPDNLTEVDVNEDQELFKSEEG